MKTLTLAIGLATLSGALFTTAVAQAQTVYRIVGPDGKVTFSDKAPIEASNVTARTAAGRVIDANPANASLPYDLRQVVARYPVTFYSGAGCAPCGAGRQMLQLRGVPYTEYTVTTPEDAEALQRLSGDRSLPFLSIGGQKIRGFSEAEWTQFLNAANYPTSTQLPPNYRNPAPKALVAAQKVAPPPETPEAPDTAQAPATVAAPAAPSPVVSPANPAGIKF